MLDLNDCDPALLHLADTVVAALSAKSASLRTQDIMVVGARCRDILQSALHHEFALSTTEDIDFGLAVADWVTYDELTGQLPATGHTRIRYRVADVPTDLMPFGAVEDPTGTVTPPARQEPISVWSFSEVFEAARPLLLPSAGTIRIPTIAGYAALKLAAWLDRSAYHQYKDAADIATVVFWYTESPAIAERLYETEHGQEILMQEGLDHPVAAARALGEDIASVIGSTRISELAERWPGPRADSLYAGMAVTNVLHWPVSPKRRRALVRGLECGMGLPSAD